MGVNGAAGPTPRVRQRFLGHRPIVIGDLRSSVDVRDLGLFDIRQRLFKQQRRPALPLGVSGLGVESMAVAPSRWREPRRQQWGRHPRPQPPCEEAQAAGLSAASARTEPPGGYENVFLAGLGGAGSGILQGLANIANAATDIATGLANEFIWAGDQVAPLVGASRRRVHHRCGRLEPGSVVAEDPMLHQLSKAFGAVAIIAGLEALTANTTPITAPSGSLRTICRLGKGVAKNKIVVFVRDKKTRGLVSMLFDCE